MHTLIILRKSNKSNLYFNSLYSFYDMICLLDTTPIMLVWCLTNTGLGDVQVL